MVFSFYDSNESKDDDIYFRAGPGNYRRTLAIAPVASELAYACNGASGKGGTGAKGSATAIKPCVPGECPTTPAGV